MADGGTVGDSLAIAAAGSRVLLERDGNITSSVCIKMLDNQSGRVAFEFIFVIISGAGLLNSFLLLPLKIFGVISESIFWPLLLGGLAVLLVINMVKSVMIKLYLKLRPECLLNKFKGLKSRAISIDKDLSSKKIAITRADEGFCIFSPHDRQLLIEGVVYRYAIFAKDVYLVEPYSAYAMSAARIKCVIGGEYLELGLCVAGQGPVRSLIDTFNPHKNASALATQINETLFGVSKDTVKRPPPIQ